MTAKQPGV